MKTINALLALMFTAIIVIALSITGLNYQFKSQGPLAQDTIIHVPSGASLNKITQILSDSGAIPAKKDYKLFFKIAVMLHDNQTELKAGEYNIDAQSSAYDIMNILKKGLSVQHSITFAEGLTTHNIIKIINENTILTGEITSEPTEGSLLPESYNFNRNDNRQTIVNRMQKSLTDKINTLWENREADLPLKTKEEAITLASIVEKETGIAMERTKVAGVFINRLKKGIALQSDPTTIYAITLGKSELGRPLYYKDLKIKSPYNTYFTPALPPAPICNPGYDSLYAVLHPEKHDYIYFVADGTGGHSFAKTLREHNNNVAKWRKIQKKNN